MDERLLDILAKKIDETISDAGMARLPELLGESGRDFELGIMVGRLYNSFYYQCRRILGRGPTKTELAEFAKYLAGRKKAMLDSLMRQRAG